MQKPGGSPSASTDLHVFRQKHGIAQRFSALRGAARSGILLQRGIAILDREAAALPGRFLPELGRSAKTERPFFCLRMIWPRDSRGARARYSAASGKFPPRATVASGTRVSRASASINFFWKAENPARRVMLSSSR